MSRPTLLFHETNLYYTLTIYIYIQICFLSRTYFVERSTRLRSISYNFTEVQVSPCNILYILFMVLYLEYTYCINWPTVIIWQEILNKNCKHRTQAVVLVAFQVTVFKQFVLPFHSVVCVYTHIEALFPECPHPPLYLRKLDNSMNKLEGHVRVQRKSFLQLAIWASWS